MQPILEVQLKVASSTSRTAITRITTLAVSAVLMMAIVAGGSPAIAEARTRRHAVRHSRRTTRRASSQPAGSVRITRYGGRGEWQGTAGARSIGLPSNTRDLTNAGIMFFANKSMPFGTRVLFSHGGYQAIGICVDRGPYTSAVFDIGPILGNELRLQGSDYVSYQVLGQ
jgi:hypothetical protein